MHAALLTTTLLLAGPVPTVLPAPAAPLSRAAPESESDAERVVIDSEDKLSLVGTYWAPRGKRAAPGALLVHDAGGRRTDLEDCAKRLWKMGFAVLTIDLRGHGESATKDLDWSQFDQEGHERLWAFATRDIKAGTEFLRGQKQVHSSSLVLVGHAAGGTLVARHAVRDEDVRAIALIDPPSQPERMYGFQLANDIESLGGLPTYITVPRESRDNAQRMAEQGQQANGGLQFVRISVFRGGAKDLPSDAKEVAELSKWLKDRAFPSKRSR